MALTAKQQSFVQYYADVGSGTYNNGTQSAKKAGYSMKTANEQAARLLANVSIKEAIAVYKAGIAVKLELTREAQHKKLQQALQMAIETKSAAAMTSAIREQNEMLGYHRDKAPNTEREAARLARMTDEERKLAELAAKLRTEAESKVKTIPFPVRERA